MLGAVGALIVLVALLGGLSVSTAGASVGTGTRTTYVPITPCRLADTRPAPSTIGPRSSPLGQNDTHTLEAFPPAGPCPIPTTATVLQLNITAIDATMVTYLTVYPSNVPRPNASSLNPRAGQGAVPNAVTTGVSPEGRFSVFNESGSVNVIIDVVGYFDDVNFDDRYYPRAAADAATAAAIQQASPKLLSPGTATSLPANQCVFVAATGASDDSTAGKIITGYITDSTGGRVSSIDNSVVFLPGTWFMTSQGGTVGRIQVCNTGSYAKPLPAGWKLVRKIGEVVPY